MPRICFLLALLALSLSLRADPKSDGLVPTPDPYQTTVDSSIDVVHAEFVIKNTFKSTARVVDITPSCSCLTVAPFTHEIASGDSIHVSVDVDIAGHDGTQMKDVVVGFEGVPQKEVTLSITILRK